MSSGAKRLEGNCEKHIENIVIMFFYGLSTLENEIYKKIFKTVSNKNKSK